MDLWSTQEENIRFITDLLKTTYLITYFYKDISTFKISTLSIVGSRITMNRSFFRLTPLFSSKLISVCVPLFCAARTVLCCLQFVRCPEIILKLTHKHEKPNHKLITDSPRSFSPHKNMESIIFIEETWTDRVAKRIWPSNRRISIGAAQCKELKEETRIIMFYWYLIINIISLR